MNVLRDAMSHAVLGWVKPELDETLRLAREQIEVFAEQPGDAAPMQQCAAYLHQVQGSLQMVELYAPAMVAEELEKLARALQDGQVQDREDACGALMRGVVLLPDYLERLQSGHRDIPIVLLPLLNEIRAARGASGLNESVLFAPDLERPLPQDIPAPEALPAQSRQARVLQAQERLDRALSAWPEDGAPADPGELAEATRSMLGVVQHTAPRRMLWVAGSVAEAVRDRALEPTPALRQGFVGVGRAVRQSHVDPGILGSAPGQESTRQLLFQVAQSDAAHPALDDLRQAFELDAATPSEAEIDHARSSISGRNRALLDTVGGVVKEELLRVKDALDLHLRTGADVRKLQPQVEQLSSVGDTLGMMGLGMARNVVLQQRDTLDGLVKGERVSDESVLLDIAGALLYVDASLDDQVARLGDPAAGPDQDVRAAEARHTVEVLAEEAIRNFAAAREGFVAFIETNWNHEQLAEVPRLLAEVAGALRILDLPVPADYLQGVRRYIEVELIGKRRVPGGQQLDTLADAMASLEYYLEALREGRPNREEILDIARASLESLRYWPPLPELHAPSAAAAAAPVFPAQLESAPPALDTLAPLALEDDTGAAPIAVDDAPAIELELSEDLIAADAAPADEPVFQFIEDDLGEAEATRPAHETPAPQAAAESGAVEEPAGLPAAEASEAPADTAPAIEAPAWDVVAFAPTPGTAPVEAVVEPAAAVELPAAGTVAGIAIGVAEGGFDIASGDIDDEIRDVFLEEFEEEIGNLRQQLPAWSLEPENLERLRSIRRIFHTLKGSGRLVGARRLGEFAWKVENMLNRVLDGTRAPTPAVVELLGRATETLPQLSAALRGQAPVTADLAGLEAVAERLAGGEEAYYAPDMAAMAPVNAPAAPASGILHPYSHLPSTPASVDGVLREILETEVGTHLETVDAWLGAARTAPLPATESLLRAFHTMNGAFAMADVPEIGEVTGPSEQYLKRLLAAGHAAPAEAVAALGEAADAVRHSVAALQWAQPQVPVFAELAAHLRTLRDSLPQARPASITVADGQSTYAGAIPGGGVLPPESPSAPGPQLTALDLSAYIDGIGDLPAVAEAATPPSLDAPITVFELSASYVSSRAAMPATQGDGSDAADAAATGTGEALAVADAATEDSVPLSAEPSEIDDTLGGIGHDADALIALELEHRDPTIRDAVVPEAPTAEVTLEPLDAAAEAEIAAALGTIPAAAVESDSTVAQESSTTFGEPVEADVEATLETAQIDVSGPDVATTDTVAITEAAAEAQDTGLSLAPLDGDTAAPVEEASEIATAAEPVLPAIEETATGTAFDAADEQPQPADELATAAGESASVTDDDMAFDLPADELAEIEAEELLEDEERAGFDTELLAIDGVPVAGAEDASAETTEAPAEAFAEPLPPVDDAAEAEAEAVADADADADADVAPAADEGAEATAEPAFADATVEADAQSEPESAIAVFAESDPVEQQPGTEDAIGEPLDFSVLDRDLVEIFVEEGNDLLDHSDRLLASLRDAPDDRGLLTGLQRDLHTLKGGARMAGINAIGDLGHAIESLLEQVAAQRVDLDRGTLQLLERGFDRLHGMLTRVAGHRSAPDPAELVAEFDDRAGGRVAATALDAAAERHEVAEAASVAAVDAAVDAAEARPALAPLSAPIDTAAFAADDDAIFAQGPAGQEQVRVRADLLDRLVNHAGEVAIYRARLEQQLGAFRGAMAELDRTNVRLHDQLRRLDLETEAQIVARYQREQDQRDPTFDPLELDRFSTLQQLSRALGESAADLSGLQGVLDDLARQYDGLLQQQSRVSSELQDGLMRARMVPFEGIVPRLRRVLRQAAAETGKQVRLQLDGVHGEMDRNVLERMTAPLEHLLRNAVAHGLEAPAARRAAGKAEEGVVRIALRREGSEMVLRVADDGAGIDHAAIRRRAEQRGMLQPGAEIAAADLERMILEPGFSTYDKVSQLAGRGVGMDVVHNEVRQLGGTLEIATAGQAGTTFTLRLPQTLAVTQAVFVQIGETQFAVPVAAVSGIGRIGRERFESEGARYLYGGEEYAIYDLGTLVGQAPARAEGQAQVPLLLVHSGELRAAVAVDQVLGNREIVVKPVGPQIASIPGIYGATITGDGSVVVILDAAPLVRRHVAQPQLPDAPVAAQEQRRVPLVMVVDDSLTMRKVTGRVLERHNFEVATARDGVEALERLEERVPDLMLLDIEMPRMDGYELATAMRADARFKDVPIVMITSRSGEKHRQRAFEIGVQRYMGKPYQELDLMRNVYDLLGIARVRE